ncbi:MAG: glycosyltransferase family 4 protein [Anaerolineae bacterium]|nr:glycosyltransferase family 4 protein [Anaerolineae bacterium]
MILKRLFSKTAAFLCIGRQNYWFYKSFGISDDRIFQTPYCVDNDFFLQQSDFWKKKRNETLSDLSLPSCQPTIIFSGKLIPRKRPFDLLSAYTAIHQEGYRANLILIGEGVLRGEIEQYIKDKRLEYARVVGFKNQTEISRFYSVGDIFVLPSVFDTWGLVINEAMLFSMPVITTDRVGAGYDLVEDGHTGYRYPAGNINALTQYLITLLTEDDLRKKMGENSLKKVLGYNYDNCIKGIMNALAYTAG